MGSPTQRSLAMLRKAGYIAAIVEHWNPFAHIRQDLFGFIDIVAIQKPDLVDIGLGKRSWMPRSFGVLFVQSTSYSNVSSRVKKCKASENLPICLYAGNRVEVHGWRKVGHRWKCRVVKVTLTVEESDE